MTVYAKRVRTTKGGRKVYEAQKTKTAKFVKVGKATWDTYTARKVKVKMKTSHAKTGVRTEPSRVHSTKDARRVEKKAKRGEAHRRVRARTGAQASKIAGLEKSALLAEGAKGGIGGKIGYGIGGGIAALILSSMMGKGDKGKAPELPMGLMMAGGGGGDTSDTLKDIARLVSILKGAQGMTGSIATPPMEPVENRNTFSAAGLVA